MKSSILVTGGAGYIGSHTAVSLAQAGFRVVLLDNLSNSDINAVTGIRSLINSEVPFYEVDCRDKDGLVEVFRKEKEKGYFINGVIHFAALKSVGESVDNPELYKDNNIVGTERLLEVMREFDVGNLVFSSSCTVYGEPEVVPVDESAQFLEAESPYGFTKQACERLIVNHSKLYTEFNSIILRYFNPIGAHPSSIIGESPSGVPNNLIPYLCQSVAGIRGPLKVFGTDYPTPDGSCIRDYLHVMDLAEAHVSSLEFLFKDKLRGIDTGWRAYNLGTGHGASVLEVINAFERVTGLEVPYSIAERREGDVVAIWANASRAKDELGWEAKRSLEEALNDSWKWQQKRPDSQ
jgi:UDP-glucose 4-epimerase